MSTSINKQNKFDAIENIIFSENLRIEKLDIDPKLDIMVIILSTGMVFSAKLSSFPLLKKGNKSQLLKFKLIGNGTGIQWPDLDEDLSLKGLLRDELLKFVKPSYLEGA
ncbi:MAG: hypothetical protein NVS9B7_29820 [Flavisolibacter sp.]